MKFNLKNTVLAMTLAGLTMTQANAQAPTNIKDVRNELGIMLNILQASLRQNNNKELRFRANSVTYLANQGVVFGISSNNHGKVFGFDLGNMLSDISAAMPVAPPVNNSGTGFGFDFDEVEFEEAIRDAFERDSEFAQDTRDKMRELSERQRDLAWEQREYERNRRDLEFEKRSADGERRKELEKELNKLASEVKKLESKRVELEKYTEELAQEQSKVAAERETARQKLYSQSLAAFEDTVGTMLCRYGAGLKALPDDENISFVLNDFIQAQDNSAIGTHDKVYVFKNKDVKACVTGKNNKEQLLSAVTTYLF
ncbi:MAG: hypothetical protein NWQ54_21435 [Paraglaciecola sp.]|uniref:hypothetical protein n=1 Tax=Pseudomonadati TaxID=3379134 RepID=UPI00273E1257|nr:hypothetical protein [Paraglaciecola sp.]MDP5029338.1 hypothetical protein [Paraglaciecola sp.]MDP5133453.1 hypothetical protein [Paraglaciecola sp.]